MTIRLALGCALLVGNLRSHIVRAAPPADGSSPTAPQDAPPPDAPPQDGPPQDSPSPDRGNDDHRPPRPPRVEDILRELSLTGDQQQKVDALTADFQQKQHQLREDFLNQLKVVLTPEQFEKIRSAIDRKPPPRADQPGNDQPAPEQPGQNQPSTSQPAASATDSPVGTVIFSGGHDLDPRDGGRPDILIAAALNVPTDVFRTAFTGVTPASGGNAPEPAQVHLNKQALLKVLGPYGVTNDRLDAVSNHYRYMRSRGQMWPTTAARATAVITNGTVTSFTIDDPGSGYTSSPTITIAGFPDLHAAATIAFTTDFKTNGSIKEITLAK